MHAGSTEGVTGKGIVSTWAAVMAEMSRSRTRQAERNSRRICAGESFAMRSCAAFRSCEMDSCKAQTITWCDPCTRIRPSSRGQGFVSLAQPATPQRTEVRRFWTCSSVGGYFMHGCMHSQKLQGLIFFQIHSFKIAIHPNIKISHTMSSIFETSTPCGRGARNASNISSSLISESNIARMGGDQICELSREQDCEG